MLGFALEGVRLAAARHSQISVDAERDEAPSSELFEVPAAVVCAFCGAPDCAGCVGADEPTQGSGVVAIIPWERPVGGLGSRFWQTAKLATLESQAFFMALPDGSVGAALVFALLAELLAVSSVALTIGAVALAVVPGLPLALVEDHALRQWVVRSVAWGVPALSLGMVGLHALHGVSLDRAALRAGSTRTARRGLRLGLYACAWDFITLPLGWFSLLVESGIGAAVRALPLALNVPGRASGAYLRGFHRLDDAAARRASRSAVVRSALIGLLVSLAAGAAFVAWMI